MDDELIHDLAAAYALDALTPEEERVFEAHLAHCDRCREDVALHLQTAAVLGFGAGRGRAPAGLRERAVAAVREERGAAPAARPRWAYTVAAVAACAAVGLGIWAAMLHSQLGSASTTRALPLRGATGAIVLDRRHATLVVSNLPPAPTGKTYQLWVIHGDAAESAGVFRSRPGATVVALSRRVPAGSAVEITLEPVPGSERPTGPPRVTSGRA